MNQKLGNITLIVPDVKPKGAAGTGIVLAKAITEEEKKAIGKQGAGRVWLFLHTDDFYRDHARYLKNGVHFLEAPREEAYGTVAVFPDRYGNKWDLLELKSDSKSNEGS